jgi:hypothetical protein
MELDTVRVKEKPSEKRKSKLFLSATSVYRQVLLK